MSGNESRIKVSYQSLKDIQPFAQKYTKAHEAESFEINVLTMFCIAFRKEVIDKIGNLDERYGMGMFEDDDYALRLRNAGYRLVCANDVYIHHFGNVSFKQYGMDLYQQLLLDNRKKFEEKWGIAWEPHQSRKMD
jgi:GT2 family glycosyltransferase